MNIAARRRANDELGDWIVSRLDELQTKGFSKNEAIDKLANKIDQWSAENDLINDRIESGERFAKKIGANPGGQKGYDGPIERLENMSDKLSAAKFVGVDGRVIETKGAQLSPLNVDDQAVKAMDQHHRTGLPVHVKGMSAAQGSVGLKTLDASMPTMTGLIPAQLLPGIVERVWPFRIADHLPSIGGDLAQFTYIKDTTTAAAQAAVVGEGQTKPTVDVALTAVTDAYVKIAGKAIFTREQSDYPAAFSYLINQLQKNVISAENHQILYGDGSTNSDGSVNMIGLKNLSGVLTATATAPTSPRSYLDNILAAIDSMNTGAALAQPNLLLTHPSTYHALVQQLDGLNRSLLAPDPSRSPLTELYGVEVRLSTDVTAGDAFFVDTTKLGYLVIREAMNIITGTNADDLARNQNTWIAELREGPAWVRASGAFYLTGLPTSVAV
jgi:HK97 family phage major capsid protein